MRLPLDVTVHRNGYREGGVREASRATIAAAKPRSRSASSAPSMCSARSADYGWSEDKARQYAVPERADFGAYVRARGFRLD